MRKWWLVIVGALLIAGGSYLAHRIQTSGGTTITDVRFPGDKGVSMSGLLYVPPQATARRPAPAVLVSHGYINTREMQSAFAIELARRGFVVLAMDMTGHGNSGSAVGQQGFGGPAALKYLRSLPMVDKANIGMEGHSLGGAPILTAAFLAPDDYKSMVLEGSTPGLFGAPGVGTPTFPKNLAVVFGQYDEFANVMWQTPKGVDIVSTPKLKALFGTSDKVVADRIYGDMAAGTARMLVQPPVTHPAEHFSAAGVTPAVDWFQKTLEGETTPLPPEDQIWFWKEVGTLLGFLGMVVLMLGTFDVLLGLAPFRALATLAEPVVERRDRKWWLAFGLTTAIPALTFIPFMKAGALFFPMKLFPQYITNNLVVWALLNVAVTLVLGLVLTGPKARFDKKVVPGVLIAVATLAAGYLSLVAVDALFKVDYRFWVLGLKPLDATHAGYVAAYILPFLAFYLVSLRSLHSRLAVRGEGAFSQYLTAALAMSLGFIVLLGVQYASLFATGLLAIPSEPLNTIIAIQFVPLGMVVGVIAAFTYRRTNSNLPGALICALLITWYVVAGTATHWHADFKLPGAAPAKVSEPREP